jgi:hypothetical protein
MSASAHAGTKYQTNLVPVSAAGQPGFSASGSSIKIDRSPMTVSGKIKKVVDGTGALVTTDGVASADDYTVEVDRSCPATAGSDNAIVPVELKNGNGKFTLTLGGFCGPGAGVGITAIRVKDAAGIVIGVGGVSE